MGSGFLIFGLLGGGLVLPGYCLSRRLLPDAGLLARWIFALGLGWVGVTTLAVGASWALAMPLGRPLVLGVALALCLASRPWSLPPAPRATWPEAAALGALLGVSLLLLAWTRLVGGGAHELFKT